jgi:prepilin-type N-terminal cleavage/methylation domain-containing protein
MVTNPQKGFTLIEILMVVAIIGLLSSIVLASLSQSKTKANTAKRLQNAAQLQNALEVYYINNSNTYPTTGGAWLSTCTVGGNTANWIPGLTPTYLGSLPTDPDVDTVNNKCCYMYKSNGVDYKLAIGYGGTNAAPTCTPLLGVYGSYAKYIDPFRDAGGNQNLQDWPGDGAGTHLYDWAIYSAGGTLF